MSTVNAVLEKVLTVRGLGILKYNVTSGEDGTISHTLEFPEAGDLEGFAMLYGGIATVDTPNPADMPAQFAITSNGEELYYPSCTGLNVNKSSYFLNTINFEIPLPMRKGDSISVYRDEVDVSGSPGLFVLYRGLLRIS